MKMSISPTTRREEALWNQGYVAVAGTDEVGAGCLAGPVVAAAVIVKPRSALLDVKDSKLLSAKKRELLSERIKEEALAWALGSASAEEIDAINIRRASMLAMERALGNLSPTPDAVLTDAWRLTSISCYQEAIVHGDRDVLSIAAASIVAKVFRDTQMKELDAAYPEYGFGVHKGYGTQKHQEALQQFGITPLHRKTFAPVAARL